MHRTGTLLSGLLMLCKNRSQHPCTVYKPQWAQCCSAKTSEMPNTFAQHSCPEQEAWFLAQCCCAETADSSLVSPHTPLCKFAIHTDLKCPTLLHSTVVQNRKHGFWLSAVVQKQLTTALCHYSHTWSLGQCCSAKTAEMPNTDEQQSCPGQETCFLPPCCSAKTADNTLCVTTLTPMQICCSY